MWTHPKRRPTPSAQRLELPTLTPTPPCSLDRDRPNPTRTMAMDHIKFCNGTGPFQILPVVKLLQGNDKTFKIICEKWQQFGYNLGLDEGEIEKLESGKSQSGNILRDVLRAWKNGHEEEANLNVLCEALIDMNLEEMAGLMREKFGRKPEETVSTSTPPAAASTSKSLKRPNSVNSQDSVETVKVGDVRQDEFGDMYVLQESLIDNMTSAELLGTFLGLAEKVAGAVSSPPARKRSKLTEAARASVSTAEASQDEDVIILAENGDVPLARPTPVLVNNAGQDKDINISRTPTTTPVNIINAGQGINLNTPDKKGDFPLLRAIRQGRNVTCIEKILKDGANVNVKTNDDVNENAAHVIIESLVGKTRTTKSALTLLNLLVDKGFHLLNDKDKKGFAPLLYAMEIKDLDEDLLYWFHINGADFNATGENGNSVLFQAISHRQSVKIIQNIVKFGGDPLHLNNCKSNVLHISAQYGHEGALETFMGLFDVNGGDKDNSTPLHRLDRLFTKTDVDYQQCLKILQKNGADFSLKNNKGYVPMVKWMISAANGGNPFPILINAKDILLPSITEEIASATLTVIVKLINSLMKFLPSSRDHPQNAFVQFIIFLISEKSGKLRLKNELKWKQDNWQWLLKIMSNSNVFKELEKVGPEWDDHFIGIKASSLGKFEFLSNSNSSVINVPLELVLVGLLNCRSYKGFIRVCQNLLNAKFCHSVVSEK